MLNVKVRILVENSQVVLESLLVILVVEICILSSAIHRLYYTHLFLWILTEGKLFVETQVPLKKLDFITHFDLIVVMDLFHLLSMLFADLLVQHLFRIVSLFVFCIVFVVQVGRARMQINERELV